MLSEQTSRGKINSTLLQKGWITSSESVNRNITLEARELAERHKNKLDGKSPDYVLYEGRAIDGKIIGVLEAKNPDINLDKALEQAIRDAKNLGVDLAIVANGFFCKTYHIPSGKSLFIDDEEVHEIISYEHALEFVHKKTNSIRTLPDKVINDRKELLKVFSRIDDYLWEDNIDAGLPRFMEFSNFLFLKLLGENKKDGLWFWDKLRGEQDKIHYLNNMIISKISEQYGGIFEGTKIKKPHVFDKIFNALDALHLASAKTDIKGDAFEYFLRHSTSTKNDLGQYFTPRHIVSAMVHLVSPTPKDTIYDPFCGTGGFLTESFSYLKQQIDMSDKKQLEHIQRNVLFGRDASSSARIAKMNSILQGDGHSGIEQVNDSLEHPVKEADKYSVGLTNIPFSQNKKNYTYTSLYEGGLAKNNGDAVCILHLFQALRKGGRMAAIVPEGFLFRKELANVRRFLTDNADLRLVVSLPQGVFLPYTGVKTDIIFLENVECPDKAKHFWYFEVKNDGFTLNNHRRKIEGHNDLDTLKSTNIEEDSEEEIIASGYIKILFEKIRQNHENWIGKQYVEVHKESSDYPLVSLSDVANIVIGDSAPQDTKYFENGIYPFFRVSDLAKHHITDYLTESKTKINELATKKLKLFKKGTILFPKSGATSLLNHRGMLGCDGYVVNHIACIIANQGFIIPKYLFHILSSVDAKNSMFNEGYPSIRKENIEKIKIPLPPLSIQQEIVEEIDSYRKIILGLKKAVSSYSPFFSEKKHWSLFKLSDVCKIHNGGTPSIEKKEYWDGLINWVTLKDLKEKYLNQTERKISTEGLKNSSAFLLPIDSVIFSSRATIGKVCITKIETATNQGFKNFICNTDKILPEFLYYSLLNYSEKISLLGTGTTYKEVSKEQISNYKILVPSIKEQKEIVVLLNSEYNMMESHQKTINHFEQKIFDKINSIWRKLEHENGC